MKALSLFACGGIGDLALRELGIEVLLANELLSDRAEVFMYNFPRTRMIVGDIWNVKQNIVSDVIRIVGKSELDLVFATPPCQGMSKNGRGKLLNLIRQGVKGACDPRNLLVIPTVEIFLAIDAKTLVMENVPEMDNTLIPDPTDESEPIKIVDYIKRELGDRFASDIRVIEFADYGVPQARQRLISIFTRDQRLVEHLKAEGTLFPHKTHSNVDGKLPKWKTLRDAISHTPPLDAGTKRTATHHSLEFHRVPLLDQDKYFWVSNTPPERGAFDNQCVNPLCLFNANRTHSAEKDSEGINRSSSATPINCVKCGQLLPRPWVREGQEFRLMKGFTSAYKRMNWDSPSPTLTRNLSYACSDNKLHPTQNRVLSLYEAMVIHGITQYDYSWKRKDGKKVSDKLIRELIGESIPPSGLEQIFTYLKDIIDGKITPSKRPIKRIQGTLF